MSGKYVGKRSISEDAKKGVHAPGCLEKWFKKRNNWQWSKMFW